MSAPPQTGIFAPNNIGGFNNAPPITGAITTFLTSFSWLPPGLTLGSNHTAYFTFLSSEYDGEYEFIMGQPGVITLTTPLNVVDFINNQTVGFITYPSDSAPHSLDRTGWSGYSTQFPNKLALGLTPIVNGVPLKPGTWYKFYMQFGVAYQYNGIYVGRFFYQDGYNIFEFFKKPDWPDYVGTPSGDGMIINIVETIRPSWGINWFYSP